MGLSLFPHPVNLSDICVFDGIFLIVVLRPFKDELARPNITSASISVPLSIVSLFDGGRSTYDAEFD